MQRAWVAFCALLVGFGLWMDLDGTPHAVPVLHTLSVFACGWTIGTWFNR
jgi:hypothetical protein